MCYPIGLNLAQCHILALDTLYQHLFSTPGRDTNTINQIKHDLAAQRTRTTYGQTSLRRTDLSRTTRNPTYGQTSLRRTDHSRITNVQPDVPTTY